MMQKSIDLPRGRETAEAHGAARTRSGLPFSGSLNSMTTTPAFVRTGRLDILGTNLLGRALYSPIFDSPTRTSDISPPNFARFQFLDPAARDFVPNFDESYYDASVQLLRATAGRDPHDRSLTDLVGELSSRSDDFRTRWAAHDVRPALRCAARPAREPWFATRMRGTLAGMVSEHLQVPDEPSSPGR